MHAVDVLKYGNLTVLKALDGIPQDEWETEGVCGWWSVKNIIAHLASFEHILEEVLATFQGGGPRPYMQAWAKGDFNDVQVAERQDMSWKETLEEYQQMHAHNMQLAAKIPLETWRETGAIPWYGEEYDLEDFIGYQYYGHKREHSAQINVFKDRFKV
jgi:uncharacterized damage-inducible protein DinB